MGFFGSSPSMPAPQPTPKIPKITDPAVEEARMRELALLRRRRGFLSTILTSGSGVSGQAPVTRKALLGE